jgi:4-amino-4-deoxy-L-arabinose transferase-like glycosyltransferase
VLINKYALIVTACFFIIFLYLSVFHHPYWYERDGIYYLNAGLQILDGDGSNVKLFNAPLGGPVIFAFFSNIFLDSFLTIKIIALLSGTIIVYVTYPIVRNFFSSKIALMAQIFIAIQPSLQYISTQAINDLLPIALMGISFYFITKKEIKTRDIIIVGLILGVCSTIRYTGIIAIISIIVFLMIRDGQFKINIKSIIMIIFVFCIGFSPVLIYNYTTYGNLTDTTPNFYLLMEQVYQTEEWRETAEQFTVEDKSITPFIDLNLFFKNYFYNIFSHNPDKLFHFTSFDNISVIPALPFIGMIPVFAGAIYLFQIKLDKVKILQIIGITILSITGVIIFGNIATHYFAIIIMPILVLGIIQIKNINKQILPLLIFPVIFFIVMSIGPAYRASLLLPMWYSLALLNSVFFIKVIPLIQKYVKEKIDETKN